MNYTVIWDPEVEQILADLWMKAADRQDVTEAADQIDQLLRTNPQQKGESRPDGRRILLVAPLGLLFRVLEEDRIVRVVHLWQFAQRRGDN